MMQETTLLQMQITSESYYQRALKHPVAGRWHRNLVKMVRSLMPSNSHRLRHLDVGCGDGLTIRMIKPLGDITAVDCDSEMLLSAAYNGLQAFEANAEDLGIFPDESFDLITCLETLEHLEHPTLALAEIYRVLKRRGFFVLTSPNVNLLFRILWFWWTHFGMGKFWKRSPHLFEYNLWNNTSHGMSLVERLRDVGFRPEKTAKANFGMVAGIRAVKL